MKIFNGSLIFFVVFPFITILAQSNSKTCLKINKTTDYEFVANFSLESFSFNLKTFNEKTYLELKVDDLVPNGKIGLPALPSYKQLIEIPFSAKAEILILNYEEQIVDLNEKGFQYKILPLQPSLRKDQDPNKVPFHKNETAYQRNEYITYPLVEIQEVGIARYINLARLVISPFQYNPVTNTIKFIKNIEFKVTYKNADYAKTLEMKNKYYSPIFDYQFRNLPVKNNNVIKDQITQYPISYLIISHRMFENTLQPFINWKTKEGYKVTVAYTDVIGTTTTAIKNYITTIYQNSTPQNPAPTYLLLVGDVAQVPTFNGTSGNHVSDTYYGTMDGSSDVIPDMYIGRMSATNTTQLQNIIEKTLEYEQYNMPDPSYLQNVLMIAGVDANYASVHGNGQINYGNQYYTNSSNGINSYTYLYGSGSPIVSNSPQAAPAIKQNISSGVGFANYTAHCASSGWADPSVTTSDVPNFTNASKYGLWIGNCCQSCKFNDPECFGEAVLRAANKGAIAYIGASNNSYWDEDYYYSVGVKSIVANPTYNPNGLGFYDRLFHLFNEPFTEWYVSAAQINYAGNLAVQQNGTFVTYYWEMYHLMGDPSLMPYLGVPTPLFVNYTQTLPIGTPNITIETEPYAYVGLSLNDTWIDAKYTGNTNFVTLDLTSIQAPCTLDVVITKQNRIPYKGTIIMVPNATPYVIYKSYVMNDSGVENNNKAEYSETIVLDVTLKNVGLQDAQSVQATLTCNNPNVVVIDSVENYGDIIASQEKTQYSAFTFIVNPVIPNQNIANFTITATDQQNQTWITNFSIILYAPVLNATNILIDDNLGNNNGRLDPGEQAIIKVLTTNIGGSLSPIAEATLSTSSSYVSITNQQYQLGQIEVNIPIYAEFPIQVNPNTPIGTNVAFSYFVDANGYTASKDFVLTIGLIVEDFESGNFTQFPWDTINYGNAPWIILSNGNIFEGNYSARSGVIGNGTWNNNTISDLRMTIVTLSADTLSFYKRVSSEENYDFMQFFVNNNKLGQWSGEVPWSRSAYYITAGTHDLIWRYTKDYSLSNGEDAAFLDFIIFPPLDLPTIKEELNTDIVQVVVFPNPTNSYFNLLINSMVKTNSQVVLYDQLGQELFSKTLFLSEGKNYITIPAGFLNDGIYYMQIKTQKLNKTLKVIKVK